MGVAQNLNIDWLKKNQLECICKRIFKDITEEEKNALGCIIIILNTLTYVMHIFITVIVGAYLVTDGIFRYSIYLFSNSFI